MSCELIFAFCPSFISFTESFSLELSFPNKWIISSIKKLKLSSTLNPFKALALKHLSKLLFSPKVFNSSKSLLYLFLSSPNKLHSFSTKIIGIFSILILVLILSFRFVVHSLFQFYSLHSIKLYLLYFIKKCQLFQDYYPGLIYPRRTRYITSSFL